MVLYGDTHIGSPLTHEDGIKETVDFINKKNRYAIFMGDGIEGITMDDPRFDPQDKMISLPSQEKDHLINLVRPIRKKHLTWLIGNHEWRLLKFGNMALDICKDLEIEYGTWSAKLSIYDEHGLLYRIFVVHGFGSVNSRLPSALRRKTNMKENLKSKLFLLAGDTMIMAMGHSHKLLIYSPEEQIEMCLTGESKLSQHYDLPDPPKEGRIPHESRYYINTGSFLKLYGDNDYPQSGYAERMGLTPNELGFVNIKVRDRKVVGVEKITV